jgi:uncharacterized protein (TIGR00288 family)
MSLKVMMLIDADNVSIDVVEQAVQRLLDEHGAIHIRRAYGTAEAAVKHAKVFTRLSIRPMVNLATGKNSTDIALAIDAIDLAISERPDVAVIVSSDSDFAPLVLRLREKGCRVEGIGQEGKTGDDAKPVYDDFADLPHRKGRAAAKSAPAKAPRAPAKPRTRSAAPARAAASPPAWPAEVQEILNAVPQLAAGRWVRLDKAAEPLRAADLLGKRAASTKLFKKHLRYFALQPENQPNEVQFLGPPSR